MPYNFDSLPSRRTSHFFNKWTAYPNTVLPMWLADMDFPVAPSIQRALHRHVEHGVLGYELPDKRLYEIVATRMKNLYGWEVDPEHILYSVGVSNAYNIAARILCSRKRGYFIQTPVFNEFFDTEPRTGAKQRVARLEKKVEGNRITYEVDFDAFEQAAKQSAMFLLCHPHNPVGKIFSRAELTRMAEICSDNDVTIVSDEIHSELLLDGARFTPLARLSREVARRTITLISASKAYNVPGLACAFAVIPDDGLRKKFQSVMDSMSLEVSIMGLTAARVVYSGGADAWLRALLKYLKSNRDFMLEFVESNFPGVRATQPDATCLAWLDFTDLSLEPSPYEFFLKEAKVALSDGAKFGNGHAGFVRLNFGTSRRILTEGLIRIKRALNSIIS
jgi:cystathionine beta-lyase